MSGGDPGRTRRHVGRLEASLRDRRDRCAKSFVPFLAGSYPDRTTFRALLLEAQVRGADAAEVGIPVPEPFADGPTITRAYRTAIAAGASVDSVLEDLAIARACGLTIPVVVMSYVDTIRDRGADRFCREAREHGADGLLAVAPGLRDGDLGSQGIDALWAVAERHSLEPVPLVAPRTPVGSLRTLLAGAGGFVYCAAVNGVTGGVAARAPSVARTVRRVRQRTDMPTLVGFGVSGPAVAREVAAVADGVIVGTALLLGIGTMRGRPAVRATGELMNGIREAVGPD